ncbi:MAG TPA: hypothetical protein VL728_01910 [Cyclobacteriaceae bacterium]|jgi:hypothetical protein|nr:hypothetical protein [Cyclobacteriaceae bacterium]
MIETIKRAVGACLIMIAPCLCQAQNYFEGKIIYQYEIKTKASNIDIKKLKDVLGSGSTLFFKEGNYYFLHVHGAYEYEFYNQRENKFYSKKRNNDTIYWRDCSKPGKAITDLEFTPKKEKVSEILCDQLKIRYKGYVDIHYFNADTILLNPFWFTDFKLNGENVINEKEKAIYLKKESEYARFTLISTAVKINREVVADKMFVLPTGAILVEKK